MGVAADVCANDKISTRSDYKTSETAVLLWLSRTFDDVAEAMYVSCILYI